MENILDTIFMRRSIREFQKIETHKQKYQFCDKTGTKVLY
jgi:hypothetical protein